MWGPERQLLRNGPQETKLSLGISCWRRKLNTSASQRRNLPHRKRFHRFNNLSDHFEEENEAQTVTGGAIP